jgi:hypothetical protein
VIRYGLKWVILHPAGKLPSAGKQPSKTGTVPKTIPVRIGIEGVAVHQRSLTPYPQTARKLAAGGVAAIIGGPEAGMHFALDVVPVAACIFRSHTHLSGETAQHSLLTALHIAVMA